MLLAFHLNLMLPNGGDMSKEQQESAKLSNSVGVNNNLDDSTDLSASFVRLVSPRAVNETTHFVPRALDAEPPKKPLNSSGLFSFTEPSQESSNNPFSSFSRNFQNTDSNNSESIEVSEAIPASKAESPSQFSMDDNSDLTKSEIRMLSGNAKKESGSLMTDSVIGYLERGEPLNESRSSELKKNNDFVFSSIPQEEPLFEVDACKFEEDVCKKVVVDDINAMLVSPPLEAKKTPTLPEKSHNKKIYPFITPFLNDSVLSESGKLIDKMMKFRLAIVSDKPVEQQKELYSEIKVLANEAGVRKFKVVKGFKSTAEGNVTDITFQHPENESLYIRCIMDKTGERITKLYNNFNNSFILIGMPDINKGTPGVYVMTGEGDAARNMVSGDLIISSDVGKEEIGIIKKLASRRLISKADITAFVFDDEVSEKAKLTISALVSQIITYNENVNKFPPDKLETVLNDQSVLYEELRKCVADTPQIIPVKIGSSYTILNTAVESPYEMCVVIKPDIANKICCRYYIGGDFGINISTNKNGFELNPIKVEKHNLLGNISIRQLDY
jgi:hypothetical protein